MRALVLVAVAGCGFQIHGGGAADDGGPDDAMRDDGMSADAPIDGSPTVDTDADGVFDADDNCITVPNVDQRNHDGDAFGDACDRCPHLFSAADPDTDGDGVGDACDPRPQNNADRRVLWAGFYDPSELAGWTIVGTSWAVSGGYLRQTGASQVGAGTPGNVNRPFVMTEMLIDNLINTNGDIGIAVQTSAVQVECTLSKGGSNVSVRSRILGGLSTSGTWPGTFAGGSQIALDVDLASGIDCHASQGLTDVAQNTAMTTDPEGQIFLGMVGIAARFNYVFVVDEAP